MHNWVEWKSGAIEKLSSVSDLLFKQMTKPSACVPSDHRKLTKGNSKEKNMFLTP